MNPERIYFIGTAEDEAYAPRLKGCMAEATVYVTFTEPTTIAEVELKCQKNFLTHVVSTSPKLLQRLLASKKEPSINNYAGSIIKRNGIEYLFIDPLKQLISVPYGQFLAKRYCSKFINPNKWLDIPKFTWELVTSGNINRVLFELLKADYIAVDIETIKDPLRITCIGYTSVRLTDTGVSLHSYVLPVTDAWSLAWMRKLNWETQAPKILQNGKYDISYLARFNAPLYNYMWDTASMMHCWYSELPKGLDSLASFFIRDSFYWKDLADTSDLLEYYKYNALDTWNTAAVFIAWMLEAPDWAKDNYLKEFPLVFPCHMAEMTGIKRDMSRLAVAQEEVGTLVKEQTASLQAMTVPNFNSNSPVQVKSLLKVLGCADLTATDEKNLKKASLRHPLNSRILNLILEIRGNRKLLSTYLTEGKELNGTILYSLTPWATDTGRLASREHHFWCGLQVQNIPRGRQVKQTLRAYAGFRLGECDLEQAETRDTAYISGDVGLIAAVESTRDFHSTNASAFFGVPYSEIYQDAVEDYIDSVTGKIVPAVKGMQLNKPLRDLAKRVNHGANYNMGAGVLIDTMGEDKIREAAKILKLPKMFSLSQIAEHLLAQFHKSYPMIRQSYYAWVIMQVETTHKLVGATGWTRYCFGSPRTSKSDLNALVAHNPQSLNAMKLNEAFMAVFYQIALKEPADFRLCAQIHDSILFMFKEGRLDLAYKVKELMQVTISITSTTKKQYTYTVPAALKLGKDGKGSIYWSDTE